MSVIATGKTGEYIVATPITSLGESFNQHKMRISVKNAISIQQIPRNMLRMLYQCAEFLLTRDLYIYRYDRCFVLERSDLAT